MVSSTTINNDNGSDGSLVLASASDDDIDSFSKEGEEHNKNTASSFQQVDVEAPSSLKNDDNFYKCLRNTEVNEDDTDKNENENENKNQKGNTEESIDGETNNKKDKASAIPEDAVVDENENEDQMENIISKRDSSFIDVHSERSCSSSLVSTGPVAGPVTNLVLAPVPQVQVTQPATSGGGNNAAGGNNNASVSIAAGNAGGENSAVGGNNDAGNSGGSLVSASPVADLVLAPVQSVQVTQPATSGGGNNAIAAGGNNSTGGSIAAGNAGGGNSAVGGNNTTGNSGGGGGCQNATVGNDLCCFCNAAGKRDSNYPADSYSFLTLYGPFRNPKYFYFGLTVFAFQFFFLVLLIFNEIFSSDDIDNPAKDTDWMARFIPANVSLTVRFAQIIAVLSYFVFADASLQDVVIAVETFPKYNYLRFNSETGRRVLSCFLRGLQGVMAILAVLLLVISSTNVLDIILNFTAVNFVSVLDNSAFELAKWGKYGPDLKAKAEEIEKLPLPECMTRNVNTKFKIYKNTVGGFAFILLALLAFVIWCQENPYVWATSTLRVQFSDSTGLQSYNGCFDAAAKKDNKDRRKIYKSFVNNTDSSKIGYCKKKRRWLFFKLKGTEYPDPCDAGEHEIAHSSTTDSFDISTSFDGGWFSAFDTPLDMYFFEVENEEDLKGNCASFANDGKCDPFLNIFDNQYDGGDCCASTCTNPETCGIGQLTYAFGEDISGDGFPDCRNEDIMVPITIRLDTLRMSRDPTVEELPEWAGDVYSNQTEWNAFWKPLLALECDGKMVFSVNLDESMSNYTETSKVEYGSDCIITVNNFDPIWHANYTVINEEGTNVNVIQQDTNSIPSEIGELTSLSNLTLAYNSLTGTIPTEIGELTNLALLNLKSNSLNGPIPIEIGSSNSSLEELDLSSNILSGMIPTEIGLLTLLTSLKLYRNSLTGTIPIEIGSLTLLTSLNLFGNSLSGTIPREIEKLTDLKSLNLLGNPSLTGPIDCSKLLNLVNSIDECEVFNPYASRTVSISSSASPSERPIGSPSENPAAGPSVSTMPSYSISPSITPSKYASPSALLSELLSGSSRTRSPSGSHAASPSASPSECATIVDFLCDKKSNNTFSFLCDLIKSSNFNLTDDWTNENIAWTVFAPTDDAFAIMMGPAVEGNLTTEELTGVYNDTLDGGLSDVPEDMLEQILQFHAVKGEKFLWKDLPCKAGDNLIAMSNGEDARIKCKDGSPYGIKGGGNDVTAKFTDVDVMACNGVIHVIDVVLLFDELKINQDRVEDG